MKPAVALSLSILAACGAAGSADVGNGPASESAAVSQHTRPDYFQFRLTRAGQDKWSTQFLTYDDQSRLDTARVYAGQLTVQDQAAFQQVSSYTYLSDGRRQVVAWDASNRVLRYTVQIPEAHDVLDPMAQSYQNYADYSAPGPDGVWLTSDDVLSHINGAVVASASEVWYFGGRDAGADGLPTTKDDVIQGCMVYETMADGELQIWDSGIVAQAPAEIVCAQEVALKSYRPASPAGSAAVTYTVGADGLAHTADDVVASYTTTWQAASENKTAKTQYDGPGADGVWFTADDDVMLSSLKTLDGNGNVLDVLVDYYGPLQDQSQQTHQHIVYAPY